MGSTLEFRFADPSLPSSVFVTVGGGSYDTTSQSSAPNVSHLVPPTLTFYATNSIGANIIYANSTVLSNLQSPVCDPKSSSFFTIGTTTVTCAAKDQNGNSVVKTFSIDVLPIQSHIPSWTKKTVGFWCNGDMTDSQLSYTMKYLVSRGTIFVQGDSLVQTPDKTSLCGWSEGKVSDHDVAKSIYLLSR